MVPISEIVGSAACGQSQAFTPQMSFGLLNQSNREVKTHARLALSRGARPARVKSVILLGFLLALRAGYAQSAVAHDPSLSEYDKSPAEIFEQEKSRRAAAEQQELFRLRVEIPDAVGDDVPSAYADPHVEPPAQKQVATERTGMKFNGLFLFGAFILTGLLVVLKLFPGLIKDLNRQFNPWANRPTAGADLSGQIRAEEEAFSQFLAAFQTGPNTTPQLPSLADAEPAAADSQESESANVLLSRNAVEAFYAGAATILVAQRKLLQEIGRARDEAVRQKLLADLCREMHNLKGESGLPEVLPVWQMASALEGLLKQLTDNVSNINPSTLRTVAGGVDLLGELCLPGLAPDLLTARPLKLLAVDDDPISRKAVSLALKRALNTPDLAEDGETALFEASKQPYDVIFLDVQMPGMDGFELCSRIHSTATNRRTPVVFVTCQSDFNARAQSTLSGGSDLIAKPFLTFEITVKALTLALRGRLREREKKTDSESAVVTLATMTSGAGTETQTTVPGDDSFVPPATSTDCARSSQLFAHVPEPGRRNPGDAEPTPVDEIATEFLSRASAHLEPLRDQFQAMFQTTDETARQDMLADVYLRIHSFTPRANLPAMHPAIQMSAALEGLLRKLLEDPRNSTVSTLITVAAGVELLNDLCELGLNSNLVTHPPIHMLVVDDDPVARRAVVGTLQMAFEKPQSAESGPAALAFTTAKPYDVIFLDVQMPGMDGFEVCSKIRESGPNRNTPVVFVTGQNDFNARTQMSLSGGSDFVGKPFLTSEITVKALTFALRGRLEKLDVAPPSTVAT